jgi:hemerythrin superfamily protein
MMDAISLLKQDHEKVSKLFEKFASAEEGKGEIAAEVCKLLTVHAQIEEEIFYPAARDALESDEQGEGLLDEAEVEHASAKELIAQIEEGDEGDHLFDAKVKVLGEYIKHHVQEEEGELFPKVKDTELDLETLGKELKARKTELLSTMEDQGDDDAIAADAPPRSKARGDGRPRTAKR